MENSRIERIVFIVPYAWILRKKNKQNKDDLMDVRHKHSQTRLMRKRKRYNGYLISNNFFFIEFHPFDEHVEHVRFIFNSRNFFEIFISEKILFLSHTHLFHRCLLLLNK